MHYSSMMNLSHLTDPLKTLHTVRSTPDWINGYENISRWRKWRWVITLSQKFSLNYIFTGSGFHQFIFRIKFYSSEPSINLQEEITRYQFVLQLKKDILKGVLPVPYDTMIELSAQALQGRYLHFSILDNWCKKDAIWTQIWQPCFLIIAEMGDYQEENTEPDVVSEFLFCPSQDESMEFDIFQRYKKLV